MSAYTLTQAHLPGTVASVGYDNRLAELFLTIFIDGTVVYSSLQETCAKDSIWLACRLSDHQIVLPRDLYIELSYADLGLQPAFSAQNATAEYHVTALSELERRLSTLGALQLLPPEMGSPDEVKIVWILGPRDEQVAAELPLRLIQSPSVDLVLDAELLAPDSPSEQSMSDADLVALLRDVGPKWERRQAAYAKISAALGITDAAL